MSESLQEKYATSHLFGSNAPFIEAAYERFLKDPKSVEPHWREYFEQVVDGGREAERPHGPVLQAVAQRMVSRRGGTAAGADLELLDRQTRVLLLVDAYRLRGHRLADLDPLGLKEPGELPDLEPEYYGLGDADLDQVFDTGNFSGPERMKLRDLVSALRQAYCGKVGWEFMHITDNEQRTWLQERIEAGSSDYGYDEELRRQILRALTGAEGMERYLHTKYVGQKRFSLEGGESLIAALDDLVHRAGENGVREAVIGMAHRGRINVLVNVMGKAPSELFSEFEGGRKQEASTGDVKYHLGFSTDVKTAGGNVHLALAFNPSHLEIVDPVVEGSIRARMERRGDRSGDAVLPILIHGDAAFAGQGVVMETFQMSQARGFYTGGTIHLVVNNQVGFTTSDQQDARSTLYCSDVAKMVEAPVFHVNGDDPEAVVFVTRLAHEFRTRFHRDVVIDIVCYRRHGHNEADEPAVTQPAMYRTIRERETTRQVYANRLRSMGVIGDDDAKRMMDEYRDGLEKGSSVARSNLGMVGNEYTVDWSRFTGDLGTEVETALSPARFSELLERLLHVPDDLELHDRVKAILRDRRKMGEDEKPLDWGFAENMAYASLVSEGYGVRLVGQDSGRGTFFHRHAVLHGQDGERQHVPLQHITPEQAPFRVIDSLLSEEAVLGFEYGYASAEPDVMVIWEAQFGDFVNGAQVVIDQFISSGEAKWGRLCGLTMFLPHGYEGQGPEHSSARLERFLQLCAQHNIQVCVPSTPGQMFHMIRRQMLRPVRKPLIVMTPKSLLRHKRSVSSVADLTEGSFKELIPEYDQSIKDAKVERLVFCSGKVYYDLVATREERGLQDAAIIRIEQLYPFPVEAYAKQIARYRHVRDIVWCQEEPMNQGAWYQIRHRLQEALSARHELHYAGREPSAAPAAGYLELHKEQQERLVDEALTATSKR